MTKEDMRICKKHILRCLTENFEYGEGKEGKPLKRKRKNYAVFTSNGWSLYEITKLEDVMDAVVSGLYLSREDSL